MHVPSLRMAGPGPGAVLAGGSFALSKLVWQWSLVAEVFSLNNLFVGFLLSLAVCFHHADTVEQRKKVIIAIPQLKLAVQCLLFV